jgi:hypothetical protein
MSPRWRSWAFISRAKGIGMSLDDIADLVASWPVGECRSLQTWGCLAGTPVREFVLVWTGRARVSSPHRPRADLLSDSLAQIAKQVVE